jgi:hypothetical protein
MPILNHSAIFDLELALDFICIFDKTFTERVGIKQRPHLCVYYFHHQSVLDDKYILMSKFIY